MDWKTFWKSDTAFVLKNLFLAVLIALLLLSVVLVWLRHYTEHGVEVDVPDVAGMYREEAQIVLADADLSMLVIDSTYSKKVPLGTIVEQIPAAGSHAKRGRMVYVVVNARTLKQVPLPELHDVSFRQAEATLRSLGIVVEDYEYEPSEYKDLILEIKMNGVSLQPGDRVAEGSKVILVVGRGKGTENVTVPNLAGMTYSEARSQLLSLYLTMGAYDYDVPPTEENMQDYVVYQQTPAVGEVVLEGTRVDIRLSMDKEKTVVLDNVTKDEDDFF